MDAPMRSWLRTAIRPPDGHPAPATYVMDQLAAAVAALLRVVVGVLGGAAAVIGLGVPARPGWVYPAVGLSLLWSLAFAYRAVRGGLSTWLTCLDVAGTSVLCLLQGELTERQALSSGAGWVALVATVSLVICQFTWRVPAAAPAGLVIVASYLAGAQRAGLADHGLAQAAIFAIQIGCAALLMWLIRRAAAAADTALTERGRVQASAQAAQARRRTEREHNRQLHDTVLATLTMVGIGAIGTSSPALRSRALADLELIEGLDRPVIPTQRRPDQPAPALVRLDERLALATSLAGELSVVLHLAACPVPATVAAAFTGATAQALANVARHAGTRAVEVRLRTGDGGVRVEVADAGTGFDPATVPATRYGIREAIVGRMLAVGGVAEVLSQPGRGTTVILEWQHD